MDDIENPIRKPLIYLVVVAAIMLPAYLLFDAYAGWRNDSYRQHIPPEVEVASLIGSGSTWDVRGGCGAAIFELTVNAKEKLSVAGITALKVFGRKHPIPLNQFQKVTGLHPLGAHG